MSDTLRARIARVQQALRADRADFLLIPPSADFRWLTGATARSTERLLLLVVPRDGDSFVLVPALESEALGHECPWLERIAWSDHENAFARLEQRVDLARRPVLRGPARPRSCRHRLS